MELPKLVFEDYYKFVMSVGIIFFLLAVFADTYIIINLQLNNILVLVAFVFYIVLFIAGIIMVRWSGSRWYGNQKLLDRRLRAETERTEFQP